MRTSLLRRACAFAFGVGVACAAAPGRPASDGQLAQCVPASLTGLAPSADELPATLASGREAGADALLDAGDALWEQLVDEAGSVLHAEEGAETADARAFLLRWVYRDPPLVVVDVDAFRFVPPVGSALVEAAFVARDVAAMRRWIARTVVPEDERRAAFQCLDAVSP